MSRRKSEPDLIVAFFTTAPDAEVAILFDVVRGIMSRRQPKAKRNVKARAVPTNQPSQTDHESEKS